MKYRPDLIFLLDFFAYRVFIFFHFPDSALSALNGLRFFIFDGVTVKTENFRVS